MTVRVKVKPDSAEYNAYMALYENAKNSWDAAKNNAKRLNFCQAWYTFDWGVHVLRSYNTVVAAIFPADPTTCYDFSRIVYGYTATTAQHISKFCKLYNADKVIIDWG